MALLRTGVAAAGATLAAGSAVVAGVAGAALLGAAPARARGEWIRVNPSTVQAGSTVTIEASCPGTRNPAKARSDVFREQLLVYRPATRTLVGKVTVPPSTPPKWYKVLLICATKAEAQTTLWVVKMATPSKGPDTGGGGMAGWPPAAQPPAGQPAGAGQPGDGQPGDGRPAAAGPARPPVADIAVLVGGLAGIGAGGALGIVALRRRRATGAT